MGDICQEYFLVFLTKKITKFSMSQLFSKGRFSGRKFQIWVILLNSELQFESTVNYSDDFPELLQMKHSTKYNNTAHIQIRNCLDNLSLKGSSKVLVWVAFCKAFKFFSGIGRNRRSTHLRSSGSGLSKVLRMQQVQFKTWLWENISF